MRHDCNDGCGVIASERMRYFPGRFLSARDFSDEQRYFRTYRYLHNRLLHGWGVARGLRVFPHPVEACRKEHVKLECGMALDCCGREIVLREAVVAPPIPWHTSPAQNVPADLGEGEASGADADELARRRRWHPLLCLEYCEDEMERVPVLYSERNCDEERREFSRVAECYRLVWHWVRHSDLPTYHWKVRDGGCPELDPCDDDCEKEHADSRHCCIDPVCPPDYCVPLAWIEGDGTSDITPEQIVTLGRPTVETPGLLLTHICAINWPHGGVVSRGHLEHHLRKLEIRFDRRLKKHEGENWSGPRGVNACTFVVQFGDGYDDLDYVSYADDPHVKDDCIAVYPIEPRNHGRPFAYLENRTVFITLKCDFILDCHGIPVDGNHLGGILPSGDGIRGGTFESWFRVMPDHEWNDLVREREEYKA